MRRTAILSAAFLIISSVVVYAQEAPSPKSLERRMNLMVIDMLMKLEEVSEISSQQDRREFLRLFASEDVPVVCDLFSTNDFLKQIPVSKYVGYYVNEDDARRFNALVYEFRDIRKLGWSYEQGKWTCRIMMSKSLNYFDENMVYFPVYEQNPDSTDFEMEVLITFNESCTECRISEISCSNSPDFNQLDETYYIIRKNEDPADAKRDEDIYFDDSFIRYNEFGQAYAPKKEFVFLDDDVLVTTNLINSTDRYEYVQFKYKPRRFRLRLRNEYAPFSSYLVSVPEGLSTSSFAYNIGLDIGYSIPVSIAFKLGIYAGLGVTYSHMSVESAPLSYSYKLSNDVGDYTRTYRLNKVSQNMKFMDLTLPIYITPEFRVHRAVSILLDLGVKLHFNTSPIVSPLYVDGNVSGTYDDGTNMVGNYGLGDISGNYSEFITMAEDSRNPVDISLVGSVGLDVGLYARTLYLQIRAGYEYGLTKSLNSSGREFFDAGEKIFPLTWYGAYEREIVLRSLTDCVSFWRRALWFSLGIMIKI